MSDSDPELDLRELMRERVRREQSLREDVLDLHQRAQAAGVPGAEKISMEIMKERLEAKVCEELMKIRAFLAERIAAHESATKAARAVIESAAQVA